MKLLKRWWFWLLVVVAVVIAGLVLSQGDEDVQYVTEVAKRTELVQSVDANGEVVSIDEVDLSFDLSGTVESIQVSIGDLVEIGDELVFLDTSELSANVASAYQAVEVALANLESQRAGSTNEVIEVAALNAQAAQATLAVAQLDAQSAEVLLGLTQARYKADSQSATAAVDTAQDNYNQATIDASQSKQDAYDDLYSAAWAGVIEARAGLGQADEVLGVRNGVFNDDYETVLSTQDTSFLTSAKAAYPGAEAALNAAEASILDASYSASTSAIQSAGERVSEALDDVALLLLQTSRVGQATITSFSYTSSQLSALLDSIEAARKAVQADQAALKNAMQVVAGALDAAQADVQDAANALTQAKAALNSTQSVEVYQVESAAQTALRSVATTSLREIEYQKAQASLRQIQALPRTVDLASYEAEVERTRATYASAAARLDKAHIRSPIVGSITDVRVKVGEQVTGSQVVVVVQTTQEQFEIAADVSESDIAKLDLGNDVIMTFDAFGSGVELEGYVGEIDPAEKLIEGVVYYRVTVYLQNAREALALRPGLTTDITIETEVRQGAITLPQRAVHEDQEGAYVMILVDGAPQRRSVTLGLRGDLGRVEILSGVIEGDEIIIRELTD